MCNVSVIIPYYNRENTIIRALKSAVGQGYKDMEVILTDDGSSDDSYKIVEDFVGCSNGNDIPIINIRQENMGPAGARNSAVRLAKGRYIAFLDSDDEWLPHKLDTQIKLMEEKNIDLLACNANIIVNDRIKRKYYTKKKLHRLSFKKALFKGYFCTPAIVVKKSVLVEVGGFPDNMRVGEDIFTFLKIVRAYKAYITNDFLVNIYKNLYGDGGLTSDLKTGEASLLKNIKICRIENYKYKEKVNIFLFACAIIFSFIKYLRRRAIVFFRKNFMNMKICILKSGAKSSGLEGKGQ